VQDFSVNSLNELTSNTNSGTLTVVGTTTSQATNVTVNGTAAAHYGDATFAASGLGLTTTYTAVAQDSFGRTASNTVTVNLSPTVAFQYDANGNLTNDGLRNFAYDDENQLIQVLVSNQWMSEFQYDAKMRRRIRQEYTWTGSSWNKTNEVRYVYDGNLVIQERDVNNLPTTTYTRGNDLSGSLEGAGGIGGLLARTAPAYADAPMAGHSYYHSDANGNVTMLVNGSEAMMAKYLYDAFGNILSKSGPLSDANVYCFSSKELHANSGLIYYLYRYYDPNLQKWPNRDPISDQGFMVVRRHRPIGELAQVLFAVLGDDPHMGGYNYLNNSPMGRYEYLGLCGGPPPPPPCTSAPPLPDSSPQCNGYGSGLYLGDSLSCFCKCAGNSAWSQQVRGCLACEFANGTDISTAHKICYKAAGGITSGPIITLGLCWVKCQAGDGTPPGPPPIPL
jgi:RHS repeat-associated protein